MKHINQAKALAMARYRRSRAEWLRQVVNEEPFEPFSICLNAPTQKIATENLEQFRKWRSDWMQMKESGFRVEEKTVSWTWLGGELSIPTSISLNSIEEVIRFFGTNQEGFDVAGFEQNCWNRALQRLSNLIENSHRKLANALTAFPDILLMAKDLEFDQICNTTLWLVENMPTHCYVREVPIVGIDTKWIESHKSILAKLLSDINEETINSSELFEYCGFREIPALIRVRNANNFIPGMPNEHMIQLPLAIINKEKPKALVVVENLQTGLSLTIPKDVPIFLGMGYGIELLSQITWIKEVPVYYSGDLDVHGVNIFARLLRICPNCSSVLMDIETLNKWKHLAVIDPTSVEKVPVNIPEKTKQLFNELQKHHIRLEQERIPINEYNRAMQSAFEALLINQTLERIQTGKERTFSSEEVEEILDL